MKIILTSTGVEVKVSDCDFEELSKYKWYLSNDYAIGGSDLKRVKMHRFILKPNTDELVDHINHNTLDNRRENLRIVNKMENIHNQRKRKNTLTRYKGVQFKKRYNVYESRCRMNGKDYQLGWYASDIAAAHAYNLKAKELSRCALLNELDYPIEYLNEIIITHRKRRSVADKQSPYKGIYWHKLSGKMKQTVWEVNLNGKYFGRFKTHDEAVKALSEKTNIQELVK